MFDLTNFTLQDMTECGAGLRACGADAMDQATAAQAIVTYLRDSLVSKPDGRKSCALVRLYVTHPYQQLPPELQAFSSRIAGGEVNPGTRCLTLMATVGDRPEWCRPQDSSGHRAIPLLSESMVSQVPMVSRLLIQLGVDIKGLLAPDEGFIRAAANRSYNVFYVRQALGSPYIPAQREFVLPYGIGSVIGCRPR